MSAFGDYPIPRHAAYLWASVDRFYLGIPALADGQLARTLEFPLTDKGLATAITILQARANTTLDHELKIGTLASPTTAQLLEMLKATKAMPAPTPKAEDLTMEDL